MAALWDQVRLTLLRRRLRSLDAKLTLAVSRGKALGGGSSLAVEQNKQVCAVLATAGAVALAKTERIARRTR